MIIFACLVVASFSSISGSCDCPFEELSCCPMSEYGIGCCPFENAVCCPDGMNCCPSGYTCDMMEKTCARDVQ